MCANRYGVNAKINPAISAASRRPVNVRASKYIAPPANTNDVRNTALKTRIGLRVAHCSGAEKMAMPSKCSEYASACEYG